MLITSWQIHGGLLYYSLPTFMLENFNTHKLKINEVVSKEDKGLHNQKY